MPNFARNAATVFPVDGLPREPARDTRLPTLDGSAVAAIFLQALAFDAFAKFFAPVVAFFVLDRAPSPCRLVFRTPEALRVSGFAVFFCPEEVFAVDAGFDRALAIEAAAKFFAPATAFFVLDRAPSPCRLVFRTPETLRVSGFAAFFCPEEVFAVAAIFPRSLALEAAAKVFAPVVAFFVLDRAPSPCRLVFRTPEALRVSGFAAFFCPEEVFAVAVIFLRALAFDAFTEFFAPAAAFFVLDRAPSPCRLVFRTPEALRVSGFAVFFCPEEVFAVDAGFDRSLALEAAAKVFAPVVDFFVFDGVSSPRGVAFPQAGTATSAISMPKISESASGAIRLRFAFAPAAAEATSTSELISSSWSTPRSRNNNSG